MNQAVFTVRAHDIVVANHVPPEIPDTLFCRGNRGLLNLPRTCVLNSRKPRSVRPDDRWLEATRACVDEAAARGYAVVSSVGTMPYNWVSFLAHQKKIPLILVCDGPLPGSGNREDTFGLEGFSDLFDPRSTLLVSPFTPDFLPSERMRGPIRDACVASLSSALWVAEIRAGGVMEKLVGDAVAQGRRVTVFHPGEFDAHTAGNKALHETGSVQPFFLPLNRVAREESPVEGEYQGGPPSPDQLEEGGYLIHFTRSCPGPWPGQSWADYLGSLADHDARAAHSGFDTLMRIILKGKIRGSSRLIRGGEEVVSFTGCSPSEVLRIRRWNRGLIRWTFEPYAIAVRTSVLQAIGVRPVIYARGEDYAALPSEDRFRFQMHNPPKTDWSNEKEWRRKGDLLLECVSPRDMAVLVAKEKFKEARTMLPGEVTVLPIT